LGVFLYQRAVAGRHPYWEVVVPPCVKCSHEKDAGTELHGIRQHRRGAYDVHVVNKGASRPATLAGLPAGVQELRICVTDRERGTEERRREIGRTGSKTPRLQGSKARKESEVS
jgi:hypothetical protein